MQELSPELKAEVSAEALFSAAKLNPTTQQVIVCDGDYLKIFGPESFHQSLKLRLPSTLYDYCWHRQHFMLMMRGLPLTLKVADTGKTLGQYPIVNQVQEVRAPMSAAFVGENKFVTGLGNRLAIGDLQTFNVDYRVLRAESLTSKSMLSAFDSLESLVVIGSYNCETYLYDAREDSIVARLIGQQGGIIQTRLHDSFLLTSGRKDNFILQWDLRNLSIPLNTCSFYREHKSHQRVLFSIADHWLGVGNDNGSIYVYDLATALLAFYFSADFDAVNSVQITGSRMVSSSGQRHLSEKQPSLLREWTLLELEH